MVRIERLIESQSEDLDLTEDEAAALSAIGRRLASDRTWFGDKVPEERSVIRCAALVPGRWTVRVQDAVGVVSVGDLQIVVEPKIPTVHLLYLFAQALQLPRLEDQPSEVEAAAALWELVARWFIRSTFSVLRRDLARDYHVVQEPLQAVRGQMERIPTARSYYSGRVELHCLFDDFTTNTPLNRLLREAARQVSRSPLLTHAVRKDAFRVLARLQDVGPFDRADLSATIDRRTWYYRDAITLARNILRSVGRTVSTGDQTAWSFLIRTPELVEAGIRQILADRLPHVAVGKTSAPIEGGAGRVHPDIVFGAGKALADVKYKVTEGDWNRPDLYEVVAFAAAFRTFESALICFARGALPCTSLKLGDIRVTRFSWNCANGPDEAADELYDAVKIWLGTSAVSTPIAS